MTQHYRQQTAMEANFLLSPESTSRVAYLGIDQRFGAIIHSTVPRYINRLRHILDTDLGRYTDLPQQDRLFVEDIDSFSKVRDVNPAIVAGYLNGGFIDLPEDVVQMALEQILDVPFHRKDWGGEVNDLYTANVVVQRSTAADGVPVEGKRVEAQDAQDSGLRRQRRPTRQTL